MKVVIKYRAPTVDFQHMPLFLYAEEMNIVEETEETIKVSHPSTSTIYEFKKKYIFTEVYPF